MYWWNAPVDEFVKIPWNQISEGCHLINGRIMCYDYKPTNAFFQSIDPKVMKYPYETLVTDTLGIIAGVILLLIICIPIWLEEKGVWKCQDFSEIVL